MEHKPIYLDGVDVSGCRHFLKDTEGQDYNTDEFIKGCCEAKGSCIGYDFAGYGLCRGDKDCYFKQLARKTQELDKYKQSLDEKNKFLQDLGISASGEFKRIKFYIENLKNKYNEKTEECEELISEKDFYLQKIAVLEQECEELKGKLRELKLKNTTLQNRNQQLDGSIVKCDRYSKALEDIGKIVKINCEEICGRKFEDCNDFLCSSKNIIDIINKAKEKG